MVAGSRAPTALLWDNHGCPPLETDAGLMPQLERYRAAGVHVVSLNVGFADRPWTEHLRALSLMRARISRHPCAYRLVATIADVDACKRDGKLGIVFDIEGMDPMLSDLSRVQTFYALGVRWMSVAYNRGNEAGGGCLDSRRAGLTALGRRIIDEMERVGMVLCLSHASAATAADALQYARNPVIFSHSNPYGDTAHPRNVSDALMRACAEKGGVIGLTGLGPFLGGRDNLIEHLLRQIRYAVDLVGADHVGLGLDFDFTPDETNAFARLNPRLFPPGMDGMGELAMLGPESIRDMHGRLAGAGLSDDQIHGILGGNWRRIAALVWR